MGKITCWACKKTCKDQALKLGDRHFHVECFKCKQCEKPLPADCFYVHDGDQFCADDYRALFGTKCQICGALVEGEVVTALGNTYHDDCFRCSLCQKKLLPGDKVTFTSERVCLCVACSDTQPSSDGLNSKASMREEDHSERQPSREMTGSRCGSRCEVDYSRFYNQSYLEKAGDFKRGPSINPPGEPSPKHYHRPANFSYSSVKRDFIEPAKRETSQLTAIDSCDGSAAVAPPRAARQIDIYHQMTNHEPIRLAKFPDAHRSATSRPGSAARQLSDMDINDINNDKDGLDSVDAKNDSEVEELMAKQRSDLMSKSYENNADGRRRPGSGSRLDFASSYYLPSNGVEFDPTTGLRNTRLRSMYLCDGFISPYRTHRKSLPILIRAEDPKKIYPYQQLLVSNFTLPPDVERMNVEKHLSTDDFERLFEMSRDEFYRLAEWKRNDLKWKVGLF